MAMVVCGGCGSALTRELERVSHHALDLDATDATPTITPGRVAVDPHPVIHQRSLYGRPLEDYEYAPAGAIVVNPHDRLDGALVDHGGGCCGLDGMDGLNQECARCHQFVALARTDCWMPFVVRFFPERSRLTPDER